MSFVQKVLEGCKKIELVKYPDLFQLVNQPLEELGSDQDNVRILFLLLREHQANIVLDNFVINQDGGLARKVELSLNVSLLI